MCSLVYEALTKLMNNTPRMQPTLAMGFAAQGIGSPCDVCITRLESLASAQAGVAATK
jgi:hypothetical protein